GPYAAIGNRRGEPTTEWVHEKTHADVQPFIFGNWVVAHNGTIANDRELLAELGYSSMPTRIDSFVIAMALDRLGWPAGVEALQGSFALLAMNMRRPRTIQWAANYKPLYSMGSTTGQRLLIGSQRHHFNGLFRPDRDPGPIPLGPYS